MSLTAITALFVLLAHASSILKLLAPSWSTLSTSAVSALQQTSARSSHSSCASPYGEESHQIGNATGETWPWLIYKSSPFNPPELQITTNGQPLAKGLLFITPSDTSTAQDVLKESAPLIMSDTGQLVWNGPVAEANNFRVASYKGRDILTFWTGFPTSKTNNGHGYGNITFLDSSYNEILVVCPKLGLTTNDGSVYPCEGDLHESFITDRDTILITAYNVTQADLSGLGGPIDGWIYDCLFFELDPKDGGIIFSWSALEHVPIVDTKYPIDSSGNKQSNPFDWFHINSVVNIGKAFLVNSRHLWSTFLVSSEGDVVCTLQVETGGDFGPLPINGKFVSYSETIFFFER